MFGSVTGIGPRVMRLCKVFILTVGAVGLSTRAMADCYSAAERLTQASIDRFNAAPKDYLATFSAGSSRSPPELISGIRDLVASDPGTLNNVLGLVRAASPSEKRAIGTGLGQATLICLQVDRVFAARIQAGVMGLQQARSEGRSAGGPATEPASTPADDLKPFLDAYQAVVGGSENIGATGGGGGGYGAGGGASGPINIGVPFGTGGGASNPFGGTQTIGTSNRSRAGFGFVSGGNGSQALSPAFGVSRSVSRAGSP